MTVTEWIEEGSENRVVHVLELPFRLLAVLAWANAIIFGAVAAAAVVAVIAMAIAGTAPF